TVHRFVAQPYEVSLEKAVSFLRDNTDAAILVIAYDGFVTMDGARTDAILVRGYVNGATKTVVFAQRYARARFLKQFKTIGQPAFIAVADI
ncbi:MAG: hypothetical protein WA668_15365, partial [Candidatus Cybelea sp.]